MTDFDSPEEWEKLSKAERLAHCCRKAASEADEHAETANPSMRDIYKRLAEQWRRVATEIEREVGHRSPAG